MASSSPQATSASTSCVAAAAGEIVFGEAEPPEIVGVVGKRQVPGDRLAAEPAGLAGIILQQDELLCREQLSRPQDRACPERVLHRHEIRMRTVGHRRRELQHRRPESAEQARQRHGRPRPGVLDRVHRLEIRAHGRHGPPVGVAARGDLGRVADAHPEHEPVWMRLGDRVGTRDHRHRIAHPDIGDPAGDHDPPRRREQQGPVTERLLAVVRLAVPEGAVPELLDLGRDVTLDGGGHPAESPEPDADASERRHPPSTPVAAHRSGTGATEVSVLTEQWLKTGGHISLVVQSRGTPPGELAPTFATRSTGARPGGT